MSFWPLVLGNAPSPDAAVEVSSDHVAAVTLVAQDGRPAIAAHATEPLPDGALVPALTGHNVKDEADVAAAVKRVLEGVGRPRRVALVVPDPVTKVSLLRFEQVPSRAQDLDQLIRWQMKKAAPFPLEEAQISWVEGARLAEGQEYVVSLARTDVIREYEAVCEQAGTHAGLVDTATFNVVNAVLAGAPPSAADWLLVNVARDYASVAILRGARLMFFRSRASDAEGTLSDLVHQTAMYYEDRLNGGGFDRVLLAGAGQPGAASAVSGWVDVDQVRRDLEARLGKSVDLVGTRIPVAATDRVAGGASLVGSLAALAGVLLRNREAHA